MSEAYPHPRLFTVAIRRGPGWTVRPEAELIDGKTFLFEYLWKIDDLPLYMGETAWSPISDSSYPDAGPAWVASGDLCEVKPNA